MAVSTFGDARDELMDMSKGALDRLGKAAWAAQKSAERITHECAMDAEKHLADARENLALVERHLQAYRDYNARLKELVRS